MSIDNTPPRTEPTADSLEAGWFRVDEMSGLSLRADEVHQVARDLLDGMPAYPLSLLSIR